jgi:O-glycosyl hydrolase
MIQGFGINDMFGKTGLPASLFDPNADIGLSILRVGMDTNGAGNLESAGMAGDITTVTRAGGKVIGSVWSPPANCKTNNNANNGGQLCSANTIAIPAHGTTANGQTLFSADPGMCPASSNTSCYTSWAQTITSFATTNKLYAMSLANEPEFASGPASEPTVGGYPTTVYTAKEMVEFVKVAGPMLQAAGIKVIAPEASEWNHLWDNHSVCGSVPSGLKSDDPLNCGCFISSSATPSATCQAAAAAPCSAACTSGGNGYDYGHALHADAAAWRAIDIIGVHEYDMQRAFPWPKSEFPKDKEVWQTEMAGVMWWPEQGPSNNIADGIVVAQWIHSALVVGEASAWLWWWYPGQADNEGLLANGNADTKRHWTLGNYSKFVRPGYMRVEVSGSAPSNVLLSAYSGPNTVVIVAINSGTGTVSVPLSVAGGTAPASCTPWLTSATANLVSQTAVPVTGGAFSASLAGSSVTTFVCK